MSSAFFSLEPGERVLWQSCPAPRAFVWRRWRLSLALLPVWLVSGVWLGRSLASATAGFSFGLGAAVWALAGCGVVGYPVMARVLWRNRQYLLTDRRVVARFGSRRRHLRQMALTDAEVFRVVPFSGSVATVILCSRTDGTVLTLHCLEGAEILLRILAGLDWSPGKAVDSPMLS